MKILPNGIAVLEGDSHVGRWIEDCGHLDHDTFTTRVAGEHIKEGDTVLDVGSLYGDHACYYSQKVGPNGIVHAFEPNPEAFECLTHNMRLYPNVKCHQAALSDRKVQGFVQVDNANMGMAWVNSHGDLKRVIEMLPLDDFNLPRVDFIKIDAEGHEPRILLGAQNTIMLFRPIMLIEVNKPALERSNFKSSSIYSILAMYGYNCRCIQGDDKLGEVQYDILCWPR